MNVSLTPHYENLVKHCVNSGRYNNASEVMREALRVWEEQRFISDWLKSEALKGYQDVLNGDVVSVDNEEDFLKLARGK